MNGTTASPNQPSGRPPGQSAPPPEPGQPAPRHRSRLKLALAVLGLLTACALGVAAYVAHEAHSFLTTAPETPGREIVVTVEPGSTFDQVATRLHEHGVITNVEYFRLLGRHEQKIGSVKAGELILHTGWTPRQVLDALVAGKSRLYTLHFREGLPWWEVARAIEAQGFGPAEAVAAAVRDEQLLKAHRIPFDTAEGFLFPETYFLPAAYRGNAAKTVEHLIESFWKQTRGLWSAQEPPVDEVRRVVTLASIVEKETGKAEERPRIAGVFHNRLERGMLLQTDPTVIYGLGLSFDGNLKKKHLQDAANTYNTYRHPGLPPGPICSPGLAAIQAAANPEEHRYLYFVSRNDGEHHFSKSLKEHNRAVCKYQLRR